MVKVKDKYKFSNLTKYRFKKISKSRYVYEISDINSLLISSIDDEYMKKGQLCLFEYINEYVKFIEPRDRITDLDVIYKMFEDGVLEYYDDISK